MAVFGQQIQIDVKQCQFLEIKTAASTINCQKQRNDAMLFIPGKTIEHINQIIYLISNVDGRSSPTQGFVNIWQNHEHGPSLSQTNTDTKKLALTDTQTHIFRTVLFPVFFGTGCESLLTCSSCSPGRINPFGLIKLSCVELLISSIDFSSSPLKWKLKRERQRGRKRRRI